jgi:hypothetical protein
MTSLVPAAASAASGPPTKACPTGNGSEWMLVTHSGPGHLSATFDFNADGQVCARWLPAFDGASGIAFMDNVVR